MLNEETHTNEILRQAGIDVPAVEVKNADAAAGFNPDAVDGDGDGLVQDSTKWERPVSPAPEPEVVAAVEEVVVKSEEAAPAAAPVKRNKSKKVAGSDFSSVPTELGSDVVVSLQRLVFENNFARNSASVIAVQKRLIECGFITAGDDNLGFLSVGTAEALVDFAKEVAIETDDFVREDIIRALFVGTPVEVIA